MPCRDGGPDINDVRIPLDLDIVARNKRQQEKIDNLTRLLCGLCNALELRNDDVNNKILNVTYTSEYVLKRNVNNVKGLALWWKEHQVCDKERLAKAKQSALAKLTDDEKEALGL